MANNPNWISTHKSKLLIVSVAIVAFVVGLLIPSPLLRNSKPFEKDLYIGNVPVVKDTINMMLSNGAEYDGTVNVANNHFEGEGILKTGHSIYSGNWKNGHLRYGKRTTPQSIYEGRFDKDLNNNGFGIIHYTLDYIALKRSQGKRDDEIIATYIGNWKNDVKSGIGRAIMADGSMIFGVFENGRLKKVHGANYEVGRKVYGIDVSHHQGDINWDNLALYCNSTGNVFHQKPSDKRYMQPVFFAYMKATQGATRKDETFDTRMKEAERHGIVKGAYHFMSFETTVEDQVKNFVETASWYPGDLPPALDIESKNSGMTGRSAETIVNMCYRWLELVEKRMGLRPIIYTTEEIRDIYLAKDPRFNKYQYWISRYRTRGPEKEEWTIWQMTQEGRVNGYDGCIDIDLFKGDYASFQKYLKSLE